MHGKSGGGSCGNPGFSALGIEFVHLKCCAWVSGAGPPRGQPRVPFLCAFLAPRRVSRAAVCTWRKSRVQSRRELPEYCRGQSWNRDRDSILFVSEVCGGRSGGGLGCSYCTTGAQSLRPVHDGPERKLLARNAFTKDEGESGMFEEVQISFCSDHNRCKNRRVITVIRGQLPGNQSPSGGGSWRAWFQNEYSSGVCASLDSVATTAPRPGTDRIGALIALPRVAVRGVSFAE